MDYDIPTLERIESIISTEEMFQEYFDEQYDMLRAVKPMIIGHFDLIRLWRSDFPLSTLVWTKIERNIDFINSYGGLVELNSRAYKKGLPSAYPLQDILEMMIRKGTKFTLSDDSHGPDDVAMHYPKLKQYCRQMGIQTVYAPWKAGNIVEIKEFPVSQVLGPW